MKKIITKNKKYTDLIYVVIYTIIVIAITLSIVNSWQVTDVIKFYMVMMICLICMLLMILLFFTTNYERYIRVRQIAPFGYYIIPLLLYKYVNMYYPLSVTYIFICYIYLLYLVWNISIYFMSFLFISQITSIFDEIKIFDKLIKHIPKNLYLSFFIAQIIFPIIYIMLIIVTELINIYFLPTNSFIKIIPNFLFILSFFFDLISVLIIYPGVKKRENYKIKFTNVNLDYEDVSNNNIYSLISNSKDNYQIFKCDFTNLFPKKAINWRVGILNFYNICYKKESGKYIYLVFPTYIKNIYETDVYLEYELEDKIQRKKFTLFLEVKTIFSKSIVTRYKINNWKEKTNKFLDSSMYKKMQIKDFDYTYLPLNIIYYNDEFKFEENAKLFNSTYKDSRKWLLHDGTFGNGKTTFDILAIISEGLQPVVISPWESNYDTDLLQLIYKDISKSYKLSLIEEIFYDKDLSIFMITFIVPALTIADKIYNTLKPYLNSLIDYQSNTLLENMVSIFLRVIIVIIIWSIISKLMPHIILFKKDSTKLYQDYYIRRIKKILNLNPRVRLVIEDADRLEKSVFIDLFRSLSKMNSNWYYKSAPIGIISFDTKEEEANKILLDLKNKTIIDQISKNYDMEESIKKYFISGLNYLKKYNADKEKMINDMIKIVKSKNIIKGKNFRDAHLHMDNIISLLKKEKISQSDIELEILKMFDKNNGISLLNIHNEVCEHMMNITNE